MPAYSSTTISEFTAEEMLRLADCSIDYIDNGKVYLKPNTVLIIDSSIYLVGNDGHFIPISSLESSNGQLITTLGCPEKIVYECVQCKRVYWPCPPKQCVCGSQKFRSKMQLID